VCLARLELPAAHHNNAAGERSELAASETERCQLQLPVRRRRMAGQVTLRLVVVEPQPLAIRMHSHSGRQRSKGEEICLAQCFSRPLIRTGVNSSLILFVHAESAQFGADERHVVLEQLSIVGIEHFDTRQRPPNAMEFSCSAPR
jgi:hypothetical protein